MFIYQRVKNQPFDHGTAIQGLRVFLRLSRDLAKTVKKWGFLEKIEVNLYIDMENNHNFNRTGSMDINGTFSISMLFLVG